MSIRHVLKSGEEVGTVAGKVIRADEYPTIYAVVGAIKEREQNELRTVKKGE